ncbi:MAG: class I SAM-dependent methyltransferase [Verrucomicrobiota bacterium]
MPETHWNRATLETRIANVQTQQRYFGGSPDPLEIAAYAAGLGDNLHMSNSALVLGMTPELRVLALARFARLISVDSNPQAVSLYRDWVQPTDRARETIVEANWFSLSTVVAQPVAAVLADGVFGNLPDRAAHERLLRAIAAVLAPSGRFVTRMAMIPDVFDPATHHADRLLARFRAREVDAAEFGFGMRLVGHYETCYDRHTGLLNNAKLFAQCAARHAAGELTDAEHAVIRRYYFGGFNCILSQCAWEQVLAAGGWEFQMRRCRGKAWYEYYPVYSCWRR